MIITSTSRNWVPVVAWTQVTLGLAGLLAVLASPFAGIVVGSVAALIAVLWRALNRASTELDQIMAEELDR